MAQGGQDDRDEEGLIDHPNAVSSRMAIRIARDATLNVLVVETDLLLDTKDMDYDAKAVEGLLAKVREFVAVNNIDGVDINPVGD